MKSLSRLRKDNIVPIIGLVLALITNISAIFWWSGRISLQMDTIIKNQEELTKEFREWRSQAEQRIGRNSTDIARLKDKVGIQ